ncbi:MAG: hypothetical protein IKT77_03520, partial [Paludibacteraceae bacterium]|nr:hypothetical protein [Paludibacteraceae bacterium]
MQFFCELFKVFAKIIWFLYTKYQFFSVNLEITPSSVLLQLSTPYSSLLILHSSFLIPHSSFLIDEVIVAIFRAPHSFTGENTVEISCHGSIYIQQEILRLLIAAGARMAGPGEFTQRAFLNGRLDLSQAEAVADLINAQSAAAHTIALNQMRGN